MWVPRKEHRSADLTWVAPLAAQRAACWALRWAAYLVAEMAGGTADPSAGAKADPKAVGSVEQMAARWADLKAGQSAVRLDSSVVTTAGNSVEQMAGSLVDWTVDTRAAKKAASTAGP